MRPVSFVRMRLDCGLAPIPHAESLNVLTPEPHAGTMLCERGRRHDHVRRDLREGGFAMAYRATKHRVHNRGIAPDSFLDQLVAWGRTTPDEIFAPNATHDVYSNIFRVLGPWRDVRHRRAVMLEVMRVLAGFESSWHWNEGRDVSNPTSVTSVTIEAGAWQVSANSMGFGPELRELVQRRAGSLDGTVFQTAMKRDHPLAMEYIARLLRRTVNHNGPVKRHEIDSWVRKDAVDEFLSLL